MPGQQESPREIRWAVHARSVTLEVGDIVLARVAGTVYLHLVSAVDQARKRVQISNNHGRINGWTSHDRVFGICIAVDDVPRPGADGKTVAGGRPGRPVGLEPEILFELAGVPSAWGRDYPTVPGR